MNTEVKESIQAWLNTAQHMINLDDISGLEYALTKALHEIQKQQP